MEISVIASGSNGNSCLIESKNTSILIDAGKSGIEIEKRLNKLNKSIENIKAIIITHGHHDHITGAGVLSRRYNIPLYIESNTFKEIQHKLGNVNKKEFSINKDFKIKDIKIKPIPTSHIVTSCGFIINNFGLFTDTGMITKEIESAMKNLKAILLESNHDIDMLINGPYPHYLKQWILSDKGHLSNIHASNLIQDRGNNLTLALLGHLSGNNNTPELARETFETLVKRKIEYKICSRDKESGTWKI